MSHARGRFFRFCIAAGVLVWSSTQATSRYEGDTTGEPGTSSDACTSLLTYEAAKAAAEAADAQYRKLDEPNWSKLSYGDGLKTHWWVRDESSLADFLRELKSELAQARQTAAAAGNPDPQQAEKNYQTANKRLDDLEKKHKSLSLQISNLDHQIKNLMVDITAIDTKLGASKPTKKPPSKDQQELAANIKKYEGIVSSKLTQIQQLTGTDDLDVARQRVANPQFREFSSEGITAKRTLYDRAATPAEMQAAQGALDTEIEKARQSAKAALSDYQTASRKLSTLQAQVVDGNDANNSGTVNTNDSATIALRNQRAAKQKQLEQKVTQKAQLGLQKPSDADLFAAEMRLNAANAMRTVAQAPRDLAQDLQAVEPWINARMARNATQGRLQKAKLDYIQAIKTKDATLAKVRNDYNTLQAWIDTQRKSLQGREQDEAYWQTVAQIKSRGRAGYSAMIAELESLDCFSDVKNLLEELRARLKKIEALRIGTPVKKPTPKPPTRANTSGIAGWWVWLRPNEKGAPDRVPMILEYHPDNNTYRGVYFPGITTKKIVKGRGPTVSIGFAPLGGNRFRYRYKYPNSSSGVGRGGGVMTLSGNRMTGNWADDAGGGSGTWTLERATAAERAALKSAIGGRG